MTDINVSAENAQTIDLEAWLGGATVAESAVEVYQDGAAFGRYQAWEKEYERAPAIAATRPDGALDDEDPLAELEAEGEALLDRLRETRSTWFLRALSFPDQLHVGLSVEHLGTSSIGYALAIFREDPDGGLELAATGRFVHVYVDADTRRPAPIPPEIRSAARLLAVSDG